MSAAEGCCICECHQCEHEDRHHGGPDEPSCGIEAPAPDAIEGRRKKVLDALEVENDRLYREGEEARAALVHVMLDVEDWRKGNFLTSETLERIDARVRTVLTKERAEDAIARQIDADDERREQAIADMLDEEDASDEWGLGNSWDWAGGD